MNEDFLLITPARHFNERSGSAVDQKQEEFIYGTPQYSSYTLGHRKIPLRFLNLFHVFDFLYFITLDVTCILGTKGIDLTQRPAVKPP